MIDDTLKEVLHPDSPNHRANGQFAPGNRAGVGYGRPRRSQEQQMLEAIRATMPPERIEATVAEALEIARSTNSWRGIMDVVRFCAEYSLGKPTVRVEQGGGGLAEVLAELRAWDYNEGEDRKE